MLGASFKNGCKLGATLKYYRKRKGARLSLTPCFSMLCSDFDFLRFRMGLNQRPLINSQKMSNSCKY